MLNCGSSRWLGILPVLLMGFSAHAETPRVVVSILPVHSLVAGVMEGVGSPFLLIPGGQSPHTFSLAPSNARELDAAELVFWVGEELETPMAKSLAALAGKARQVRLMELPGLERRPVREGGVWDAHSHGETADEHPGGHHGHAHHYDPHIWLSPRNAGRIVRVAAQELSALDPDHAVRYHRNAKAVLNRLRQLDRDLVRRLAPLRTVPYIVFHDAYQSLEHHYRLSPVGSVAVSPEQPPGAKRIRELRAKVVDLGARCAFSEPQFEPRLVRVLVEGTPAGTGVLDPLGADLMPGPDAYFQVMENLADALVACLS